MHDEAFLHKSEPPKIHARHKRRQIWRAVITSILVLLVVWMVLFILAIGQLLAAGLDVRDRLIQASEAVQNQEFEHARQEVAYASGSLKELEQFLTFFDSIWFIPGLDRELADMQSVFVSSRLLLDSLDGVFKLGQDIVQLAGLTSEHISDVQTLISPESTFQDLPTATKHSILQRLSTASDDFDLLSARIQIATIEFERLRTNRLMAPFIGVLDPFLDHMEAVHQELRVASTFAHVLPELAGLDGERTHLLLFLNNDELRPGGGFIGTYGVLNTKNGEIISLLTKDVYALDQLSEGYLQTVPPEPLKKYNATTTWYLRDANWDPDFAQSAIDVIDLFEKESVFVEAESAVPSSTHIDGVIGFTPNFASALLSYLGPIEVGGQVFHADNVPELIEYEVEQGFQQNGIPYPQRKEILAELVRQIQDRLVELPFAKWQSIFYLLAQNIQHKQLAMYSTNTSVEHALVAAGWAGTLEGSTADVQMYVDANLASLKTDPVVNRSVQYDVFRNESGTWIGRTSVTYDHTGQFDWRTTRYRTYARLLVPEGTTLIRTVGFLEGPDIAQEVGLTSFGGFVVIEPGQIQTVVFEYRLSDRVVESIAKQHYQLRVLKQMGARDYPLTLDLDFDKNVLTALPAENRNAWGDDVYHLNTKLTQDLFFEVGL